MKFEGLRKILKGLYLQSIASLLWLVDDPYKIIRESSMNKKRSVDDYNIRDLENVYRIDIRSIPSEITEKTEYYPPQYGFKENLVDRLKKSEE